MPSSTASRRLSVVLVLASLAAAVNADAGATRPADRLPVERPDDPPGVAAGAHPSSVAATTASVLTFGRFTHHQVNVNALGANITGDAANEPSLAVDPTNHDRMVIGWRQFDTVASNFRQAGYGYTTDGGMTWKTGKIQPGVFRSDPVLGVDSGGRFLYSSLTLSQVTGNPIAQLFASTDGGATWGPAVQAYGGDKQWMAVDRTGGPGQGFIYQAWSVVGNDYYPATFDRSTDGGATFQFPTEIDPSAPPIWGTLDLGTDDSLYVGGMDPNFGNITVARSSNASNGLATPAFTTVVADANDFINTGGPNPAGLNGQVWVAVDKSNGPRHGWVYELASVQTPTDPMDVMFCRSTDGGKTWSAPVRVNDDPLSSKAWQWFGTMSVGPDGRIDAVWNDSRLTGDSTRTALFYSSSFDGGTTWTANEQVSPVWNSMVGFPSQSKIGDYYHMVSDWTGADLAWANTFNGEEDVWYTRISPRPTAVADGERQPARLLGGAPNPFASATTIRFVVPVSGARVRLEVFDATGQRVATLADGPMPGGPQTAVWDGRDAAGRQVGAGLYLCRYQSGGVSGSAKLLRVR